IELVEKQHALSRPSVIEQTGESSCRLTEETANDGIVPDSKYGNGKLSGDGLCKGGFPVTWRPQEKEPVPRLCAMRAKQVSPPLLLHHLVASGSSFVSEDEILESSLWLQLVDETFGYAGDGTSAKSF